MRKEGEMGSDKTVRGGRREREGDRKEKAMENERERGRERS